MKIIHTADWHIGKKLHKHQLSEDFDLFIDWLCQLIKEKEVDLLVVSGDIFDMANPSSEARRQYFKALVRLTKMDCQLILTGGNHDSPAMLNAPYEILQAININVIGGLPENLEEVIIPIHNAQGSPELIVAALPYLREADLRKAGEGETYEERLTYIQNGIESYFTKAANICQEKYPNIPAIALGHLFATGASTSDSEREIQVGNQAAFNAQRFGTYFQYIALGHIHKPQQVKALTPTFYSGSPLPLSFSERKDEKRILLLNTDQTWEPESIPVPRFRKLLRLSGTLENIQEKLAHLENVTTLNSLIEIELKEESYNAVKMLQLEEIITDFDKENFEIVKHKVQFKNQVKGASELYQGEHLDDLKPRDVFCELLATHTYEKEDKTSILSAFDELLEHLYTDENA